MNIIFSLFVIKISVPKTYEVEKQLSGEIYKVVYNINGLGQYLI